MCRWLAYSGSPVRLDDLLYKPTNSLVMQSKHSRLGAEPLGDLHGAWQEVPDATCVVVHGGEVELYPFAPSPPSVAACL